MEEEKALKIIAAIRQKADKILEIRANYQIMKNGLEPVNEKVRGKRNSYTVHRTFDNSVVMLHPIIPIDMRRPMKRDDSIINHMLESDAKVTSMTIRHEAEMKKKCDLVDIMRTQKAQEKKVREKSDIRDLKEARRRRDSIM